MNKLGNEKNNPFTAPNSERIRILSVKEVKDAKGNCDFVIHKLEKTLDNGDIATFYKASKFFKLMRVSKASKENDKMMSIQADIMRGIYSADISLIQIVANILTPSPIGLLYLYGVQSTGKTEIDATTKCARDFKAFIGPFKGTHRTAHLEYPKNEEMTWVVRKIREQQYIVYVKGIPSPRDSVGGTPKANTLLNEATTSKEEQMEQFLTGLSTDEFVLMITATPVDQDVLRGWLSRSLKEATKWESQKTGSNSFSAGISIPMSMGNSSGTSLGNSDGSSLGTSSGTSEGLSSGTSDGSSSGSTYGTSSGTSEGASTSDSNGSSSGLSSSNGYSSGNSSGSSWGESVGASVTANPTGVLVSGQVTAGHNWGFNNGLSNGSSSNYGSSAGTTSSQGTGTSTGLTNSTSAGSSLGESHSATTGSSFGKSNGTSAGTTTGSSFGTSSNSSFSAGLAPSVSIGKTFQFTDKQVEYICKLLQVQNERLENSTEGEGMFYVDFYISSHDEGTQKSISSLVDTAWINNDTKIDVLRGVVPKRHYEQQKLSLHMLAFSPCFDMEINRNGKFYKYASLLESSELAAYTHPPRISAGGLDAAMEDRPRMRVPVDRQNREIFIGNVVNGENYSLDHYEKYGNGYQTDFKFCIGANELHHAVISGSSGSGKSVLATRLVSELYNNIETVDDLTGTRKRNRILILDPKAEWRQMCYVTPPEKFNFYSLGNPNFHALKMNILRVPKYISANDYLNMVVEHFCSAYGLAERAIAQLSTVIYKLYDKVQAFTPPNVEDELWANEVTGEITMEDVYDDIEKERDQAQKLGQKYNVDALTTYLTRLQKFKFKASKEYIMFCNKGGMSSENVLGDDSITVIESSGLSAQAQSFFFTLFMESIFRFAQGTQGFYREGQYQTFIILEEANTVLSPSGSGVDDNGGTAALKKFEAILDQSRSFGLFIWTITQKVGAMPDSVTANAGLIFAGKCLREADSQVLLKALGFDGKFEDRDAAKWLPRMPIGEFIVKLNKGEKEVDQEPVMIKVAQINLSKPSNEELEVIIQQGNMIRERNKENNF